jgi:PAS domain S-box-containing protein
MDNSKKGATQSSLPDPMLVDLGEAKFRNLIMQAPVLITTFQGPHFIVETINKTALEIWGKSYEEVINRPLFEVSPEVEDNLKKIFSDIYATGETFIVSEYMIQLKRNGKPDTAYFSSVYQPLRDLNNEIYGIISIGTEITEVVSARKQIEANAMLIHDIYMNAPASICTFKGPKHIYELVNPAYQKLFDTRDLVGKSLLEALPELEGQGVDKILDNVYNTGEIFKSTEIPVLLARADNVDPEKRYFNTTMQPIYNEDRKIIGVVNFGYDVTEQIMARKQIEASEAKFRTLSETIPHMIWTASPDGKKNFFNKYFLDYTGKNFDELTGDGFSKIIFPADLEQDLQLWDHSLKTGTDFKMEKRIRRHDGIYRWHISHGIAQKDEQGKITGWIGSSTDIDEHKSFYKDLIEAKVLAEKTTLIAEDEKEKAEIAMQSKQQFLSNMSHEIRTPMNAIIGFTKVLMKTDLTEKQTKYLQAIKSSGNTLIVLINDILDLAKVDAGKMIFINAPFQISDSITTILHLFEIKIQEKNLQLVKEYDAEIPKVLLGDSVRLHQILINLLSNAIKFTSEGKIIVSVNLLNEDKEKVTLEIKVTDTGIGIPENKIKNIFIDFEQAYTDTSRVYGGTGLGLAIVKQLVEKQGGTISVNSKADEGSTFSFTLNFQKTNDDVIFENVTERYETETKALKVLVVEDIKLNQLLVRTILDDYKFAWDIADNGKIAIDKLQSDSYDIILMDLQMPIMNGFEATEHIRNKMNLQIPIIALTADVTSVDLGKCKAAGMNDYISKPIDEKLLYRKILDLVKSK